MSGTRCSVKNCTNLPTSLSESDSLSFHRFPRDKINREKWIYYCNQPKSWVPKQSSRICSSHFENIDFERRLKEEPLQSRLKRRLKKNAIPTGKFWAGAKLVDDLEENILRNNGCEALIDFNTNQEVNSEISPSEMFNLKHDLEILKNEYEQQKKVVSNMMKYNTSLAAQLLKEKSRNNYLEDTILNLNQELLKCIPKSQVNQKIKQVVSGSLSPAQIDKISKTKKKICWSKEDISKAITLRYFSKRAYLFLQKENFPLPTLRTLQAYCSNINPTSGLLKDVLTCMNARAEEMSKQEKAVVLLYDKLKVSSMYEYDKKRDAVIGPFDHVQIVMARGLFGNWKQPVHISFDRDINWNVLQEIITALHVVNFDVVAIVGDHRTCDQENFGDLGINLDQEYLKHPSTGRRIFCFPDSLYLLKEIRWWFSQTGFHLSSGESITKQLLDEMMDETETNSLFEERFNCTENSKKENVSLPCNLLSNSTVVVLKKYYNNCEGSESLVNFIQLINDWFDIMNSRSLDEALYFKKPYKGSRQQFQKLNEIYNVIETLRCIGKPNLLRFQELILLSIKSLLGLFKEMKKRYGINFIFTSRLSQEVVESLFRVLRMQGGLDEPPNPMSVIHMLKRILLGKSFDPNHFHTNIYDDDDEEIISSNVLEKAQLVSSLQENEYDDDEEYTNGTSSNSNSSASPCEQMEEDGVEYLSGWLARKFSVTYPEICTSTYGLQHEEHPYAKRSTVEELLYVTLTEPSPKLKKSIQILQARFKEINKGRITMRNNILKRLVSKLKEDVDIPEEITKAFIEKMIFIRMKQMNTKKT